MTIYDTNHRFRPTITVSGAILHNILFGLCYPERGYLGNMTAKINLAALADHDEAPRGAKFITQ